MFLVVITAARIVKVLSRMTKSGLGLDLQRQGKGWKVWGRNCFSLHCNRNRYDK